MIRAMWSKGNMPPLLVGVQTGTPAMEINMAVPQKEPMYLKVHQTTFGHIPKWHFVLPQGHLLIHLLSCLINNVQKLETT